MSSLWTAKLSKCRGASGALARQAARSLRFAPELRDIAVRIRQDVTGGSNVPLSGVHLRLEHDAVAAWLGHTSKEVSWRTTRSVCPSQQVLIWHEASVSQGLCCLLQDVE